MRSVLCRAEPITNAKFARMLTYHGNRDTTVHILKKVPAFLKTCFSSSPADYDTSVWNLFLISFQIQNEL